MSSRVDIQVEDTKKLKRDMYEDDPDVVSFPVAFIDSVIVLVGLSLVGWGVTVVSPALFLAGVACTLLGLWLYGAILRLH
jgi:hypothetical protein